MRKILNRYVDELMSLEVLGWYDEALRIKGVLAPARVSRNGRLYLPEELRKMAEEGIGRYRSTGSTSQPRTRSGRPRSTGMG